MRLKITHVTGCYALVVADSFGTFRKDHIVKHAFYDPKNDTEKEARLNEMRAYSHGISDGYDLARRALEGIHISSTVEEFSAKESGNA
jgi:ribosomal protein S16